jgi:cytochrome c2
MKKYAFKQFLLVLIVLVMLAACQNQAQDGNNGAEIPGGNPDNGVTLMTVYGCNGCHWIPDVPGADSLIGPPLIHWRDRLYIVGMLINTPENTMAFIMSPQSFRPGTVMINMDVTPEDAQDMVAHLYRLTRDRSR